MASSWLDRPSDYRCLHNPAFCGILLARAAREYEDVAGHGMPLPLAFLILPLSTPTLFRASLPNNAAASIAAWVAEHPYVRVGLADSVRNSVALTREALVFCLQRRALAVNSAQLVSAVPRRIGSTAELERASSMTQEMIGKARFLGRWFARSGGTATIYFMLGLKP
jgi:ABC-three component (ABC-3C) system Middle Component 3